MKRFRFVCSLRYVVPSLLLLPACYANAPLTTELPAPATRLIATVTDTGSVAMANTIGPGAREVEGVITSASSNQWEMNLIRVDHRGGSSVLWNREQVKFPRFALTNATIKRLDMNRSLMAGALIGVSAFLAARAFGGGAATDDGQRPPEPPANRVPGGAVRLP